jgi:hypothetical protein
MCSIINELQKASPVAELFYWHYFGKKPAQERGRKALVRFYIWLGILFVKRQS